MTNLKDYLLAENDRLRQENIRLHNRVDELSEDVGYYKGVVNAKGYIERNYDGTIIGVKFEADDTLKEIASVCRCTSDELENLMWEIYAGDWEGQDVYWENEE